MENKNAMKLLGWNSAKTKKKIPMFSKYHESSLNFDKNNKLVNGPPTFYKYLHIR